VSGAWPGIGNVFDSEERFVSETVLDSVIKNLYGHSRASLANRQPYLHLLACLLGLVSNMVTARWPFASAREDKGAGQAGTESQSPAPTATEPSAPTPSPGNPRKRRPHRHDPPGSLKQGAGTHHCGLPAGISRLHASRPIQQLRQAKHTSLDRPSRITRHIRLNVREYARDRPPERARVRSAGVPPPSGPPAHPQAARGPGPSFRQRMPRPFRSAGPVASGPLAPEVAMKRQQALCMRWLFAVRCRCRASPPLPPPLTCRFSPVD